MNKEYMNDKDTLEYIISDEEGNLTRRYITGDVDKILDLENRIELLEWTKTKIEYFIYDRKYSLKVGLGIFLAMEFMLLIIIGILILNSPLASLVTGGIISLVICGCAIPDIKIINEAKKQFPIIEKKIEVLREQLEHEKEVNLETSVPMFTSNVLESYRKLKEELVHKIYMNKIRELESIYDYVEEPSLSEGEKTLSLQQKNSD